MKSVLSIMSVSVVLATVACSGNKTPALVDEGQGVTTEVVGATEVSSDSTGELVNFVGPAGSDPVLLLHYAFSEMDMFEPDLSIYGNQGLNKANAEVYSLNGFGYLFGSEADVENHSIKASNLAMNFGNKGLTVSVWVKSNVNARRQNILYAKGKDGDVPAQISLSWEDHGVIECNINTKIASYLNSSDTVGKSITLRQFKSYNIGYDDNRWHHVACVFDDVNNRGYLYVDGVSFHHAFPQASAMTDIDLSGGDLNIGGVVTPVGNNYYLHPFFGSIDEVQIWKKALTLEEVQLLMQPLVGDFDQDGDVDTDDLTIYNSEFGQTGFTLKADADFDNDVDGEDFLLWQRHVTNSST